MSTDKEVQDIQNRKLKEKGAKIVEQQQQEYDPEKLLFNLLELFRVRGLEMMNISEDAKAMIYNYKQGKLQERNKEDGRRG